MPVWFPRPGYWATVGALTDSSRVIAGRYRLVEHLGSGGMGHVWLAQDELLRRRVAVKEVSPPAGLSGDERARLRERTLREARAAARLNHPNVVTVYDIVEDDGRPWIVMELVQARSLRELVDENGPMDPRAVARMGLQLLGALQSAHAIGIVHRDVKPGNVLLDAEGRAVLADFGIARAESGPATTTPGVLVGSPSYIAPERARGERGGPASDLWSLGATLYAAVEGRPPYDRAGALPTLMAVVSEDPDPPRHAGILWPVIKGLLAADPSDRLNPAAAGRMLRQVAESGAARVTAPLPGASQLTGHRPAGAGPGKPAGALERAERTRVLHPSASMAPATANWWPWPAEPPEPLQPQAGRPAPTGPGKVGPGPAPPADGGPERRRPRRAYVLVLAAAVLAAGAALGLYIANQPAAGPSAAGRPDHSTAAPGRSQPAAPGSPGTRTQPATSGSQSPPASPTAQPSPPPGSGTQAVVPAGYHTYRDPTGFSIAMPNGWRVSHQGHYTYLTPPSGAGFLLIDQSDHPQPSPLADWQQQEASRRATYAGYHRIRLAAIHYPQAEKAADWEFTYYRNGVLTHVLNRNILANAQHAYALYWSTPESQWASEQPVFEVLARTFQPAQGPPA
jgi:eukaryotic-like serine/threonine-protein kinase